MPWETAPENSQSLTSHLPSNTCSLSPHLLPGIHSPGTPPPTHREEPRSEIRTRSCSENSHQQSPWQDKVQTWHLEWGGGGGRIGMTAWSSDTRRKNSQEKKKKSHSLRTPSAVVCCKRHRLPLYRIQRQLGSRPTRHTCWQKKKIFL